MSPNFDIREVFSTGMPIALRKIRDRIAMAKVVFSKKILLIRKLDLQLRKNLFECYEWSVALYGSETWTIRKMERKYLEALRCGVGE